MCQIKVRYLFYFFTSFFDLCCNRLVPLIEPADNKLSEKIIHLVERLVPSSITYSSSGKIFSRTYLAPKMTVTLVGIPLCIAAAKQDFILELKKSDSDRVAYIRKQKGVLKIRKRVG